MWVKGTDLRDDKTGVYRWPPVADGPEFAEDAAQYTGCTTILKRVFGEPDIAHAVWVGQEARRLFGLHDAKLPALVSDVYLAEDGCTLIREAYEKPAKDLILEPNYLEKHGFRMSGRAADRGTVVHEFLRYWCIEGALSPVDVPFWVEDRIAQGDGLLPYRCDPDETIGYTVALCHWLADTGFRILFTEIPGFHDGLGYAATLDAGGVFPGGDCLWVVDAKTRGQSRREDALQLAAQVGTEWLGKPGTAERVRWADLAGGLPIKAASLLVTPEKVTFRECAPCWPSWLSVCEVANYMTAPMPFSTVKTAVSKTRMEVATV